MRVACRLRDSLRKFSIFGDRSCARDSGIPVALLSSEHGNDTRLLPVTTRRRSIPGRVSLSRTFHMQPSMFNVQVPVADGSDVFLMNTFSDAQLLVSSDVTRLMERVSRGDGGFSDEERETLEALVENGFMVESRNDERAALDKYFRDLREDTDQLRVTVLTTLQCNFACDYCFQGDHGDYNKFAEKMSLETAAKVVAWIERRMDEVKPAKFVLTLFGGEPLLNLPIAYYLAEQCHALCQARGIPQGVSVITNGLLLTPEVVARLKPYGLHGVKVTLDGDRDTHNR